MSNVSLVDGHIDEPKFTDEQIIKALECCNNKSGSCMGCPLQKLDGCVNQLQISALDLINRKDAKIDELQRKIVSCNSEIERLHALCKPTETSGYRIENGKVVFYTKILNGYRYEYESLDRVVNDMNIMLQNAYKTDEIAGHYKGKIKTAKSKAIKEFAEKITEVFMRYAHLHSYAERARLDDIEALGGTRIEMQSVWDVITLNKHGLAEYEEMKRLQDNIETIANERLLTEIEKDFRLILKEMDGEQNE